MRPIEYKTKTSEEILAFLATQNDTGLSVMDIFEEMKKKNPKTNITTIYRQLDKLIASKKVIMHSADNGKKNLYQYIADKQTCLSHLHIQCTNCSKIIHLDCSESNDFTSHIEKEHGIRLDFSKTVLYGLCNECSKKQAR
ncbi:Fur family transcriptional regulator [Treponema sp.]|uniref:Fur family transcriptional regulator n=1 Tax=Treponema sp. TaxID=166 RepID=UPI00298E151F|nr:transcriptional repressor [Treponema sp.]MCR5612610.1 transcriptional repressor [Treponema sp.]